MGNNRGAAEASAKAIHERQLAEKTEIAKNVGLYGAQVIAASLKGIGKCIESSINNLADAPKELLSEQYGGIAIALLEATIVNYWERLAQGCQTDGKEDLCKYFRQEGQAPCLDPHSKFKCPVYLATGSPMCANRPFLANVQGLTRITPSKCQDVEFQIEFLIHLLFTIDPEHPRNQYVRDIHVLQGLSRKWGGLDLGGPMFLEESGDLCFLGFSGTGFDPDEHVHAAWDSFDWDTADWANRRLSVVGKRTACSHSSWYTVELDDGKIIHQCADCYHHVVAKGKKNRIYGG